jgi:hypothetical protein
MSAITLRFIKIAGLLIVCTFALTMAVLSNSRSAQAAQVCGDGQRIPMGKYYLFSNLWGANTGTGKQCIWDVSNNDSNIAWGTSWNWSEPGGVKSYNSAVLGWHWQKEANARRRYRPPSAIIRSSASENGLDVCHQPEWLVCYLQRCL